MHHWKNPGMLLLYIALLCRGLFSADSISFTDAREMILRHNAAVKAAETEILAAEQGVRQAGAIPNPALSVGAERFESPEMEAAVEQTIELGGKRKLRKKAARAEVELARNARSLSRLELEGEIVRRFARLAAASARLTLLDSIIATVEATRTQIERRVAAGASRPTDLLRAEIELDRHGFERAELQRRLHHARTDFAALGDPKDSTLLRVSGSLNESPALPPLPRLRTALASSPRIVETDLEIARLDVEHTRLDAERVPDLDVAAGVKYSTEDGSSAPVFGLSMGVPLFNRSDAARKQVLHQQQALRHRRVNRLQRMETQLLGLHTRVAEIHRQSEALRNGTIPKAEKAYGMIREYYAAGSVDFTELMQSQSDMLQLHMMLLDLSLERAVLLADMMQLTALEIAIIDQEE